MLLESQAEGHPTIPVDRPGGIPRDFPSMIIRIGDVAAKPAMRRSIAVAQYAPARSSKPMQHHPDLLRRSNIVRQREGSRPRQAGSSHIVLKRLLDPSSENKAIHLVEYDVCILEDWRPAKAAHVEALRSIKISHAERYHGDLLLHLNSLSLAQAGAHERQGHGTRHRTDAKGPALAGAGPTAPA